MSVDQFSNYCFGNGRFGSCTGDSDGPLVCRNDAGSWDVVGITSYGGRDCIKEGMPSASTRVDNFIDWIKEHMID